MTSRINRLATLARVYLKNGPTVYLAAKRVQGRIEGEFAEQTQDEVARDIKGQIAQRRQGMVDATTTDGDRILIPTDQIVDVVFPVQADIAVPAGVFCGKRLQVRNLADYTRDNRPEGIQLEGFDLQGDPEDYTVLTGEDLAEAEIVVVNVATGHVAWLNPAVPNEANDLAIQATLMLARMEELTNVAYGEQEMGLAS